MPTSNPSPLTGQGPLQPGQQYASATPTAPKWTYAPEDTLYNKSFYKVTKQYPVAAVDLTFSLVWVNPDGSINKKISIYPSETIQPKVENSSNGPKDAIQVLIGNMVAYDKYNFLRSIKSKRITSIGGNTLELNMIDPSGYIIDQTVLDAYLASFVKSGAAVHCEISYGWSGDPDKKRVGSGANWILYGISVDTEYTGASYSFKFIDTTSNALNVKLPDWARSPKIPDNVGTKNGDTVELTFPEAMKVMWDNMVNCKFDKFGKGKILLITDDGTYGGLPPAAWSGTSEWTGKKMPFANWPTGELTFLQWIQNAIATENKDKKDHLYTCSFITPDSPLRGKSTSYQMYNSQSWSSIPNGVANTARSEQSKEFWYLNNDYTAVYIHRSDELEAAASAEERAANGDPPQATVKEGYVRKTYAYLTADLDIHNTIINLKVDSSALFGRYLMRASGRSMSNTITQGAPAQTNKGDDPANPVEANKSSDGAGSCSNTLMSGTGSQLDGSADTEAADKKDGADNRIRYNNAMSFAAIGLHLQVIGDPDLSEALRNYVQIKLGTSSGATLPWVEGTYLLISLTDDIADGFWTSELSLIKMGDIPSADNSSSVSSATAPIAAAQATGTSTGPIIPGAGVTSSAPVMPNPATTIPSPLDAAAAGQSAAKDAQSTTPLTELDSAVASQALRDLGTMLLSGYKGPTGK